MADRLTAAPAGSALEVRDLKIRYQSKRTKRTLLAVDSISFCVSRGELVCVIGPSGCGKSSVLGALAGLVPYTGHAEAFGKPITGPHTDRAVVFQSASLLPWRTVERNIKYGLELQHVARRTADESTARVMELVGLTKFKDSYPNELSGGMQQRVNFARALASDPAVLLMDEPFAALDAQTRERLQLEIADIWQETDKAGVFITHQIDEAVFLGDRVVVLGPGPRSKVVAQFEVDLKRPRSAATREEPEFHSLVSRMRGLLGLSA
ncbi:MAG TPA: ABC transporter ATP-binding protein [Trebonia sp.]|jgi:NitT/TauT family transport system ATP-binding protein|nr:ABC transporter ATP-binding protein [Trebonia sp.]